MKILQLFGGVIRRGGEEMFVYNVLRNMNDPELSFDCLVIEDCENGDFRSLVENNGGKMYEFNIPLHATRFTNHIYKPVREFFRSHRIDAYTPAYDIVHIHSSSISALAVLSAAAHRAGIPKVIVHSHSTGQADSLQHKLFRFLASVSMRGHVDEYCACSVPAAEWKFTPKYSKRAVIIKNGINTEAFRFSAEKREQIRSELNIPSDAYVIGHIGRLCTIKNQAFLIKSFRIAAEKMPDAKLLLTGDGEDGDMLRTLVAEAGLTDKVIFHGSVTNVPDYMCAMDVFAFPSLYEGLGIVAIEAQCSGLPVIASKGVPREIELTDSVVFLPLSEDESACPLWAEKLCAYRGRERRDNIGAVRSAGYDISSAVEQIREIYYK